MFGYSIEVGMIVAINAALCLVALLAVDGWQGEVFVISVGAIQALVWKKIDGV